MKPETDTRVLEADEHTGTVRIDTFIANQELKLSRNVIQRLIREGCVKVRGKAVKCSDKILPGQTCTIELDDYIINPPTELVPEKMDLNIIYEDDHLLAVNKPTGISVHPGAGNRTGTLAHGLLAHTDQLSRAGGYDRPGIVHRLDKNTSGVLLVAKTNHVHNMLSRQFMERTVRKEYWALVWGIFQEKECTVDEPLARHPEHRKKISVRVDGKPAVTRVHVLSEHGFCSAVRAAPKTGRTHQIRVHLSHIHHPVMGDVKYGGTRKRIGCVSPLYKQKAEQVIKEIDRYLLHARQIQFRHPVTEKEMTLRADFPEDILRVQKMLEGFS